jgi:hypothetical protein
MFADFRYRREFGSTHRRSFVFVRLLPVLPLHARRCACVTACALRADHVHACRALRCAHARTHARACAQTVPLACARADAQMQAPLRVCACTEIASAQARAHIHAHKQLRTRTGTYCDSRTCTQPDANPQPGRRSRAALTLVTRRTQNVEITILRRHA